MNEVDDIDEHSKKVMERRKEISEAVRFQMAKDKFIRCAECDRVLMKKEMNDGICSACKALEAIQDIRRKLFLMTR